MRVVNGQHCAAARNFALQFAHAAMREGLREGSEFDATRDRRGGEEAEP